MPAAKRRSGQSEGGKRQSKYTNLDLPQGAQVNNAWRKKFITTYEKWLGTRSEPWDVAEKDSCEALQLIWNTIYPHIDYVVDADGPVFYIVSVFLFFGRYLYILMTNRQINALQSGGVLLAQMPFHCSKPHLRESSLLKIRSRLLANCSRTVLLCMQIRVANRNR
jgi:hypothetical protein